MANRAMGWGYVLVEGPRWWSEQSLKAGKAIIEGKEFLAEPWDQSLINGFRLRSTWVRIIGLSIKHWHRAEFERLVEKFGVLLEIDRATEEKTSLIDAKIRVGVCAQSDIPAFGKAIFKNDVGEWCWKPVRFVVDAPGQGMVSRAKRRRVWVRKPDPKDPEADAGKDKMGEDDFIDDEGDDLELDLDEYEKKEQGANEDQGSVFEEIERSIVLVESVSETEHDLDAEQDITEDQGLVIEEMDRSIVLLGSSSKQVASGKIDTEEPQQKTVLSAKEVDNSVKAVDKEEITEVIEEVQPLQQLLPVESREVEGRKQEGANVVTRQSIRQKKLGPELPVQTKAVQRSKMKNLELATIPGNTSFSDYFSFEEWEDTQVVSMLQGYGLKLADREEKSIECVQFLRSLSRKQFENVLDEMEFKVQYGTKFLKKDADKRAKLDKILSRVSQFKLK